MSRALCIKDFLTKNTHRDLSDLYNAGMEVQVNVRQCTDGQRLPGTKAKVFTNGAEQWSSFRCPKGSMDQVQDNSGDQVTFNFNERVDAIGMTGWDFKNKVSRWVAYDFDSIVGHSASHEKVLTAEQLLAVQKAATSIDFVTVRRSTAGRGLHLYVFFDEPVPTDNHTQHAKLGSVVLSHISALTGHDFVSKVDTCGSNMWVWARKMVGTDGLTVIKHGVPMTTLPSNWRDVVYSEDTERGKHKPRHVGEQDIEEFDRLSMEKQLVPLDKEHKALIQWLSASGNNWWWDTDRWMLVTHTKLLKMAHDELNLRGVYATSSGGQDLDEQNCFCYPMRNGAWVVRRFSKGTGEATTWTKDAKGWTRCFFNMVPDMATAAKSLNGVENPKGGYEFSRADQAQAALNNMGINLDLPLDVATRPATIISKQDGRVVITIPSDKYSKFDLPGWSQDNKGYSKVLYTSASTINQSEDLENYDDVVRHLVSDGCDGGWVVNADGTWRDEPLSHVKAVLESENVKKGDINAQIGSAVTKPWSLVVMPFAPEYPGDRRWNRNSAKLNYAPADTDTPKHPTWDMVLNHSGSDLTKYIEGNQWFKDAGITTGGDYLLSWIASVIRRPFEPLPYLFFCSSEQNTGKSTFHEALDALFDRGVVRADVALTSKFNGELLGAVVCVVEETDLRSDKNAYNKIKDWTTSKKLPIHNKGDTTVLVPNTTHWIQCANRHSFCPVMPGDTRITMVTVPVLTHEIPKQELFDRLRKEASDFVKTLYDIDLPPPCGRLALPIVVTDVKQAAEATNTDPVEAYIRTTVVKCNGMKIPYEKLYERFLSTLHPGEIDEWNKNKFSRQLPDPILIARDTNNTRYALNYKFTDDTSPVPVGVMYVRQPNGYYEVKHTT